jgi:hypothetical protein
MILFISIAGLRGQVAWPPGPPVTPNDQRNSLKIVGAEVQWLQNATRTAANYGANGYGVVRNQFEKVRAAYGGFKRTLTPRQWEFGANDLAELDAGLDIIQEAFLIFENDIANGRSNSSALRSMCQVLNQATPLWMKELNRVSSRLRVGFP